MASLKVDENLPWEATSLLRGAGHDALSVHDQNMVGSTDDSIAEVCKAEGRAIVTLDLDFADIRAYPPDAYSGMIVLRLDRQDKPHVVEVLARMIPKLDDESLEGKLWIVSEHTIRIRG